MNARDVSSTHTYQSIYLAPFEKWGTRKIAEAESPYETLIGQASHGCLDSVRTLSSLCTFMGLDKPGSDFLKSEASFDKGRDRQTEQYQN